VTELLGWASAATLLLVLIKQVHKQWKEANSEGISQWLFVGQLVASVGFTIYSVLTGSWVFTLTNAALTITNFIGLYLYFRFRR
jgi:uncharacterized protein with PQ loop repeat